MIRAGLFTLFAACLAGQAAADPPASVVSMNLCTDQLAMMLAEEGQLVSVTALARDPSSSVMAEEAANYPINHGRAEEIYLMAPDLVLAGAFENAATLDMLRSLGIAVEVFEPANSLEDISARLAQMGTVLGRAPQADAAIADFETRLAALQSQITERPRAALYYVNGYTSGDSTLAGQILQAAGFDNAVTAAGYDGTRPIPLELMVMIAPDLIVTGAPYPGTSRGQDVLRHPALRAIPDAGTVQTDPNWICGTPHVLRAIENLAEIRRDMTE
ncbi:ABC transporter substrate-binding protein [Paracoccaceae bacterium GXU_MW_L88]